MIDYKKYPTNWKTEIRPAILARAEHKCEFCGVHNYALGYRDKDKVFHTTAVFDSYANALRKKTMLNFFGTQGLHYIIIVLTIAHLDQDISNNDPENLQALCQRCHLNFDRKFRKSKSIKND